MSQPSELELIRLLTRNLPINDSVKVATGDDCAVLDLGSPDTEILFKTDAVVEGVHFLASSPPEKVGHKALARCLSDIAAMAGRPRAALVTLGLPRLYAAERVTAVYAGMKVLAQRYDVAIVGGETTVSLGGLFLSIAVVGTVSKGQGVLRSGARVGDAIFVTGELGGSRAGKHLEFEPRLREARWLAEHVDLHAMIDLSDGLATDLRHVLEASQAGAELLRTAIPIDQAARQQARAESAAKPPLLAALTDGEDFELLFTVASQDAVPLRDAWKRDFPQLALSCIGRVTAERGLRLRDQDGLRELRERGYEHLVE